MTDDELLAAADLLPMSTPGLYDDRVRQEIDHVLTREEALAVARSRLGLPAPATEADRLRAERDEARDVARRLLAGVPIAVEEHPWLVRDRDDDVQRRIRQRIDWLTRNRAWPWQQPGAVSVALADEGNIVEVRVAEDGTVTEQPLGDDRDSPSDDGRCE